VKKSLSVVAVAVAAMALLGQSAQAGDDFRFFPGDQRLVLPSVAVGVATTGAYFAIRNHGGGGPHRFTQLSAWGLSTVGCMSLTPIVSGIVVQREMTRREVHVMMANCVVPFVGGWLMNSYFNHHPERDSVPPPVMRHHHRHHHG
jgi:hypothetical protein